MIYLYKVEIKYLRLIKTIADEGSIVNAASKLFLTQSALSHQLSAIENKMAFKIFHRTRKRWKLTEEGEELYRVAGEVLLSIERGLNNIKYIKEESKGVVKVGSECTSFYRGFPSFLQKMSGLYPEIQIDLKECSAHSVDKLLTYEIDVSIVTVKPTHPEIASVELFKNNFVALMSRHHPLADRPYIDILDFANSNLIIQTLPLQTVAVYQHLLLPHNVKPKQIIDGKQTEICLEMVENGLGIYCVPQWVLKPFKISNNILQKQLGKEGLKCIHYLIYRSADIKKRHICDFVNSFEEDFSFEGNDL